MLARKNQLQANKQSPTFITLEKARLTQARTLAIRRQDTAELAVIDAQLAELLARTGHSSREEEAPSIIDMLAQVNERNRKANAETVRKAELLESERKRRERRLA